MPGIHKALGSVPEIKDVVRKPEDTPVQLKPTTCCYLPKQKLKCMKENISSHRLGMAPSRERRWS